MAQIRLLSSTLILTLLIWASADSLVTEEATLTVGVQLVPSSQSQGMLVRLEGNADAVEVKVSGPRRSIEALQAKGTRRIRIPVAERPTGSSLIILDRLSIQAALAALSREFERFAVVAVQPDSLPVFVDHLVNRDVEVTLKRLKMAYDVEPQLQSTRLRVRMRESALSSSEGQAPSTMDLSSDFERLLRDQPVGKPLTVSVVIDQRPFGPDAEIVPPSVDVVATVKSRRTTESIPTVPVLIAISFSNLQRPFSAVTRDGNHLSLVTQTITVTGSPEDVARLVRGETRAFGLIQLKEDDFEQMGVFKLLTPEYHLPKGVEMTEVPPPIEFKLVNVTDGNLGG